MNANIEQVLIAKLRALPPEKQAEVMDFVDFVSARAMRRGGIDRLLAIAPALVAVGIQPVKEDEISAEIEMARAARRERASR